MLFKNREDKIKEQPLTLQLPHSIIDTLLRIAEIRLSDIRSSISSQSTMMTLIKPSPSELDDILRTVQALRDQLERIEYLISYLSEKNPETPENDKYEVIELFPEDADILLPLISRELDMIEQSLNNSSKEHKDLSEQEFKTRMSIYTKAMAKRNDLSTLKEYLMFYRYKI